MIEDLLSRLDKVRKISDGYIACCPAHDDKSPSLAITERSGKILLNCFAGCDPEAILAAIHLRWRDLFSDAMDSSRNAMSNHVGHMMRKRMREFDPLELDRAVLVYANAVWDQGRELGVEDMARVKLAVERLEAARDSAK